MASRPSLSTTISIGWQTSSQRSERQSVSSLHGAPIPHERVHAAAREVSSGPLDVSVIEDGSVLECGAVSSGVGVVSSDVVSSDAVSMALAPSLVVLPSEVTDERSVLCVGFDVCVWGTSGEAAVVLPFHGGGPGGGVPLGGSSDVGASEEAAISAEPRRVASRSPTGRQANKGPTSKQHHEEIR